MKKLFVASLFLGAFFLAFQFAAAQISLPQPSPHAVVTQDVGLTQVTVDYYRPKKKGRAIFGSGSEYLVPFGEVWRTGANAGTVVTFSDPVRFREDMLDAGSYLLLTRPGSNRWDIMFYSDTTLGGNVGELDPDKIVLQTSATPGKLTEMVKTFTINISDLSDDNKRAAIELAWENTVIRVGFEVDYDSKVMEMIDQNTQVDLGNLMAAANYYLDTDRNLEQALEWANAYLAQNPEEFWNIHIKARILAKLGRTEEAIATAKQSMELAQGNAGGDFGYVRRNQDFIAELQK